jgi:hypothetical protein
MVRASADIADAKRARVSASSSTTITRIAVRGISFIGLAGKS